MSSLRRVVVAALTTALLALTGCTAVTGSAARPADPIAGSAAGPTNTATVPTTGSAVPAGTGRWEVTAGTPVTSTAADLPAAARSWQSGIVTMVPSGHPMQLATKDGAALDSLATITVSLDQRLPTGADATLAWWNEQEQRWESVETTIGPDRRTVTATTEHFSIWEIFTYMFADLSGGRFDPPTCSGSVPSWAVIPDYFSDINAPVHWCAGSDPGNKNLLVVKVVANRATGARIIPNVKASWMRAGLGDATVDDFLKLAVVGSAVDLPGAAKAVLRGGTIALPGATVEMAFSEKDVREAGTLRIHPEIDPSMAVSGLIYKMLGEVSDPMKAISTLLAVGSCVQELAKSVTVPVLVRCLTGTLTTENIVNLMYDTVTKGLKKQWNDGWKSRTVALAKGFKLLSLFMIVDNALEAMLDGRWKDSVDLTMVPKIVRTTAPSGQPTTQTEVHPFTADGRLRLPQATSGIDSTRWQNCHPASVSKSPQVYTCGSVADHLPACWLPATVGYYFCMHGPTDTSVVSWYHDSSKPVQPTSQSGHPHPWSIVLDNGQRCGVRLGGAWPQPPQGYLYSYSCDGSGPYWALVAPESADRPEIDTSSPHWTVWADNDVKKTATKKPVKVGIKEAIFAAPPPAVQLPSTGPACPTRADLKPALFPTWSLRDTGEITCLGDWANAPVSYEGMTGGAVGLFRKASGTWKQIDRNEYCKVPGDLPMGYFRLCFVG